MYILMMTMMTGYFTYCEWVALSVSTYDDLLLLSVYIIQHYNALLSVCQRVVVFLDLRLR